MSGLYSPDNILVEYTQLDISQQEGNRRRLETAPSSVAVPFSFKQDTSLGTTLWLKLNPQQSLKNVQLLASIPDYYIFPGKTLQNSNSTYLLESFDQYTDEQIQQSKPFENMSKFLSICMCIFFLFNLIPNTGYLLYNMIDYYQILFILLFLNVDYPPSINYFLNGFRYAHYLFLPQIFASGQTGAKTMSEKTPAKFGVIVSDANFLTNTGHDFIIMFIIFGVFGLLKLVDCFGRGSPSPSNKISNHDPSVKANNENDSEHNRLPQNAPS